MALRRRPSEVQGELWVATDSIAEAPGHVFYDRLNTLLREAGFDRFVEDLVTPFYADGGRPGIAPGVYFRMLFVGYFEGIDSQRGIALRCEDSLSLRKFLGMTLKEPVPDHSSLTRIRDRFPVEITEQVFAFVLQMAGEHKLISGARVGVDATLLEANAAMKSIVRRDSDEDWKSYIRSGSDAEVKRVTADNGYHSNQQITDCTALGLTTYIPEPGLKYPGRWTDKGADVKTAVLNNRRRTRGAKGRALQRLRSERVERSFAHVCETGGARRTWLRGLEKINKRYAMVVAAHNLGIMMRKLFGCGKPRHFGIFRLAALMCLLLLASHRAIRCVAKIVDTAGVTIVNRFRHTHASDPQRQITPSSTGC